jgi:hypothetical protein
MATPESLFIYELMVSLLIGTDIIFLHYENLRPEVSKFFFVTTEVYKNDSKKSL